MESNSQEFSHGEHTTIIDTVPEFILTRQEWLINISMDEWNSQISMLVKEETYGRYIDPIFDLLGSGHTTHLLFQSGRT